MNRIMIFLNIPYCCESTKQFCFFKIIINFDSNSVNSEQNDRRNRDPRGSVNKSE